MQDKLIYLTCPLGAVFAAASVAIARRAALQVSEQPKLLNSEQSAP